MIEVEYQEKIKILEAGIEYLADQLVKHGVHLNVGRTYVITGQPDYINREVNKAGHRVDWINKAHNLNESELEQYK